MKRLFSAILVLTAGVVATWPGSAVGSSAVGPAEVNDTTVAATDDDIWREVNLGELDYQKSKNYCMRIYGYYRYIDDGVGEVVNRKYQLYRVYEGICELDVRYGKNEDDGAVVLHGSDLVHPDRPGKFMDFYELSPFTFLEKAKRLPKKFTTEAHGDSTLVYTKNGLAGYAVKDTARQELRMVYNVIAPDTVMSLNLLIASAKLKSADAVAVYQLDDTGVDYVPQGNLKRIIFEGDLTVTVLNKSYEDFHEYTELYVDSVVYLTKDEYKASMKLGKKKRGEQAGYTYADIERLKAKYGVPPLTQQQIDRIEDQRDWDEKEELQKSIRRN